MSKKSLIILIVVLAIVTLAFFLLSSRSPLTQPRGGLNSDIDQYNPAGLTANVDAAPTIEEVLDWNAENVVGYRDCLEASLSTEEMDELLAFPERRLFSPREIEVLNGCDGVLVDSQ